MKDHSQPAGWVQVVGGMMFHAAPLGITYRVEADGKTVSVLRVWQFRKKRSQP